MKLSHILGEEGLLRTSGLSSNTDTKVLGNMKEAERLLKEAQEMLQRESDALYALADSGSYPTGVGGPNHKGNIRRDAASNVRGVLEYMRSQTGHFSEAFKK